jgi:class 3 adenylate cyclase
VPPKTRYARNGDVSLAYQVFGEGDLDLLLVSGWIPSIESFWLDPLHARFYERLGSFARVICMDKRGTGLSDRVAPDSLPLLEERMDDIGAVMDAAGSERAALFGLSEGASLCMLFAATYPERTQALVSYGGYPSQLYREEMPWAPEKEAFEEFVERVELGWDEAGRLLKLWAPSVGDDPIEQERFAHALQRGASPGAAAAWLRMLGQTDIREVLPTISVPTLILHRSGDQLIVPENSYYMAEHIPGARYVELEGSDHLWWYGDQDAILDEVEEFLTGQRPPPEPDRVLATVMFTDIVGSTERAAALGDAEWRRLVERHDGLIRAELARHRGEEVKTMGDGFLATFDGPARGIRCAAAARDAVRSLGIEIRAGLHTGECERMNGDIGGIAVAIGARIGSLADGGEVLVSSTVKDLVVGSGIEFADRGAHRLKGVPGEWQLFAADPGG